MTRIAPGWLARWWSAAARWSGRLDGEKFIVQFGEDAVVVRADEIDDVFLMHGWIWSAAHVAGTELFLPGLRRKQAEELKSEIARFVSRALSERLKHCADASRALNDRIDSFYARDQYLSASDAEMFLRECRAKSEQFTDDMREQQKIFSHPLFVESAVADGGAAADALRWRRRLGDLESGREELRRRNEAFVAEEMRRHAEFFDNVEKTPLTEEQRRAAIVMEDRHLLVAAAGSGKTSAIVGKIGYALSRGFCRPEEILALAFNKKAAEELKQRMEKRLGRLSHGETIRAATFHSYGLELTATARGKKPRVAEWTMEEGGVGGGAAEAMIEQAADQHPGLFAQLFSFYRRAMKPIHQFNTRRDYEKYLVAAAEKTRAGEALTSMNGERVRSQEEQTIADFLYQIGVDYVYEGGYEFDTASESHGQYKPDFFYPAAKVYHEHFALDQNGEPPPFIDRARYLQGVEWKRQLHKDKETTLIETTSAMFEDGSVLEFLRSELEKHGALAGAQPRGWREIKNRLQEHMIRPIYNLMNTFLAHWKAAALSAEELRGRLQSLPPSIRPRVGVFLEAMIAYRRLYDKKLADAGEIDFADMLAEGAKAMSDGKAAHNFRLILVDEFQDISRDRARLLRAMLRRRPECKLFAVGDDWQAIYRFAGADLSIMTNFAEEFGDAAEDRLTKTFRFNQGIADVASSFVVKNPAQIKKKVVADDSSQNAAQIIYYGGGGEDERVIESRLKELAARRVSASVYMLARYNYLRPQRLRQWREQFGKVLKIEFSTAHKAKGLEADYVFVLGLCEGRFGFPSAIADDPVLDLVAPPKEPFELAEERRLFYVALTRARRKVFLLAEKSAPSRFVAELIKQGGEAMDIFAEERGALGKVAASLLCPQCGEGLLLERDGKYNDFLGCSTYPLCDYTQNIERPCPQCGNTLKKRPGKYGRFWGCSAYPRCNYTENIAADAKANSSRQ